MLYIMALFKIGKQSLILTTSYLLSLLALLQIN
jgi:hypothetical protein